MLSLLPSYEGKTVLEFGAGIGRFTGDLAKKAGHVIALDFIDSVIKKVTHLLYLDNMFLIIERKNMLPIFGACLIFSFNCLFLQNEEVNGHFENVKFMCADVTSPDLNFSEGSVDLIFSNWLLMYLSDKEVNTLFHNLLFPLLTVGI